MCGDEAERSFHALVACGHAKLLWERMPSVWMLAMESLLIDTGKDWLLNVLARCPDNMHDMFIILIWRISQLSTDMVLGKEIPPIQATAKYLGSYMKSLIQSRSYSTNKMIKGKMTMFEYEPK